LSADNHGEGGFFCCHAVKDKIKWLIVPAIIGGSALLADGIITPLFQFHQQWKELEPIIPK
jgi:KUP system potassium uptake protein